MPDRPSLPVLSKLLGQFTMSPSARPPLGPPTMSPSARPPLGPPGVALEWSTDGGVVLDLGHVGDVEAQSAEMADVVLRALCGGREQSPGRHPTVFTMEPECREKEEPGEIRTP